jgi:hypothetical protein
VQPVVKVRRCTEASVMDDASGPSKARPAFAKGYGRSAEVQR